MALSERLEEIGQEARGQRREDTDPDLTVLTAPDRGHFRLGQPDLGKRLAAALDELLAGLGELHAAGRAREQGGAEPIFQITDPSADSQLLNSKSGGGPAKTAMIRRGNHITNVPNLNGQCKNSSSIIPLLFDRAFFKIVFDALADVRKPEFVSRSSNRSDVLRDLNGSLEKIVKLACAEVVAEAARAGADITAKPIRNGAPKGPSLTF